MSNEQSSSRMIANSMLIIAVLLLCSACTPSASMRTEQKLTTIDVSTVKCVVVRTPKKALVTIPTFKDDKAKRLFNAELRFAQVYFAERMASELKQLDDPLSVRRTGDCQDGLVISATITDFNPGRAITGGMTMGFAADVNIHQDEAGSPIGSFHLSHGKGANAVATAVSLASPVPIVQSVSDMPTLLDGLVNKAVAAIEKAIDAGKPKNASNKNR
jgi:hypothetical protein